MSLKLMIVAGITFETSARVGLKVNRMRHVIPQIRQNECEIEPLFFEMER